MVKIILVSGSFVLIGNFIINNLLNLNIEWAVNILSILAGLIAVYIWYNAFSNDNLIKSLGTIQNKIMAGIFLTAFLVIAYFPDSQGINNRNIILLFLLLAILITVPFWWYLLRRTK
jgi:hypothetical protein